LSQNNLFLYDTVVGMCEFDQHCIFLSLICKRWQLVAVSCLISINIAYPFATYMYRVAQESKPLPYDQKIVLNHIKACQ